MQHTTSNRSKSSRRALLLLALPVLGFVLYMAGQEGVYGLTHEIGYAVCHQITVRSYIFDDLVLPLCARCTGQYLGIVAGMFLAGLWGRLRSASLPPPWLVAVLLGFLLIWAFDGFNSYVYLIIRRPLFYEPNNILRISTGLLQGLAICFLFLPYFNQVFWAYPDPTPILRGGRDLLMALIVGAVIVVAVNTTWPPLFYPLAILSTGGAFFLLSMVGTMFALLILRQENSNRTARDFATFFVPGMALAVLLLLSVNLLRSYAQLNLGFALPTG